MERPISLLKIGTGYKGSSAKGRKENGTVEEKRREFITT